MKNHELIGASLRAIRKEKGITCDAISAASGISKGHLMNIENGRLKSKFSTLEKLATVFGITVKEIASRAGVAELPAPVYADGSATAIRTPDGLKLNNEEEYNAWVCLRQRCLSPKYRDYHRYGGRGITVCERWQSSFAAFLEDMGKRPAGNGQRISIGRIDNDGPYSPENCRWETQAQQTRNTRRNRLITHNGKTQTHRDWANELGLSWSALHWRLANHPVDVALSKPKYVGRAASPMGFLKSL